MLQSDFNSETVHVTLKELFSSIRELNRRIDELKIVHSHPLCQHDMKDFLKERIWRLYSTKFCLIYSIYDLRMNVLKSFSQEGDEKLRNIFTVENLSKELRNL